MRPGNWETWSNQQRIDWLNNLPVGSDSTLWNLYDQVTTDITAAPLDSLNNQLGKFARNIFVNPFVLILALVVGYFLFKWIAKKFA